jgi:hypothetical protein
MKKVLLIGLGVVLAANVAFADHIGIYGDAAGATCTLALLAPFAPINTYVIHKFTTGTTGSQWKIIDTSTLFQAGTASPYAVLGNAYTGASVAYGGCLVGQVTAMTLTHLWFGQAVVCGKMEVVSDPLAPYIQVTDCNFAAKQATGGQFFFNPNGTCTNCNEVATETTTWGTIKALYR